MFLWVKRLLLAASLLASDNSTILCSRDLILESMALIIWNTRIFWNLAHRQCQWRENDTGHMGQGGGPSERQDRQTRDATSLYPKRQRAHSPSDGTHSLYQRRLHIPPVAEGPAANTRRRTCWGTWHSLSQQASLKSLCRPHVTWAAGASKPCICKFLFLSPTGLSFSEWFLLTQPLLS